MRQKMHAVTFTYYLKIKSIYIYIDTEPLAKENEIQLPIPLISILTENNPTDELPKSNKLMCTKIQRRY